LETTALKRNKNYKEEEEEQNEDTYLIDDVMENRAHVELIHTHTHYLLLKKLFMYCYVMNQ
jgi:hypothetical protein